MHRKIALKRLKLVQLLTDDALCAFRIILNLRTAGYKIAGTRSQIIWFKIAKIINCIKRCRILSKRRYQLALYSHFSLCREMFKFLWSNRHSPVGNRLDKSGSGRTPCSFMINKAKFFYSKYALLQIFKILLQTQRYWSLSGIYTMYVNDLFWFHKSAVNKVCYEKVWMQNLALI